VCFSVKELGLECYLGEQEGKMVNILETETFSEIIAGLDDYSEKKKR
jgi:hypothetical protein